MKILGRLSLFCVLALTMTTGVAHLNRAAADDSAAKKHGPILWTESFDGARKTAAKQKKVRFVDFWAEWCGPCHEMLDTTYKDKAVVSRARQFVPVLLDVDKNPSIAQQYNIESIPTVIFLDANGKVLLRSEGYRNASDFLKLMDQAEKKAKS